MVWLCSTIIYHGRSSLRYEQGDLYIYFLDMQSSSVYLNPPLSILKNSASTMLRFPISFWINLGRASISLISETPTRM